MMKNVYTFPPTDGYTWGKPGRSDEELDILAFRPSFTIYRARLADAYHLTRDQKGELLEMIMYYQDHDCQLPKAKASDDQIVNIVFNHICEGFVMDEEKYIANTRQRREAGKKGGRPPKEE